MTKYLPRTHFRDFLLCLTYGTIMSFLGYLYFKGSFLHYFFNYGFYVFSAPFVFYSLKIRPPLTKEHILSDKKAHLQHVFLMFIFCLTSLLLSNERSGPLSYFLLLPIPSILITLGIRMYSFKDIAHVIPQLNTRKIASFFLRVLMVLSIAFIIEKILINDRENKYLMVNIYEFVKHALIFAYVFSVIELHRYINND